MTLVVHLSADYPDRIDATKTRAIVNLVDATSGSLDHRVYSLNRRSGLQGWLRPGECEVSHDDGRLVSLGYHAPGRGVYLLRAMSRVAEFLARDLADRGIRPALIHGQKLSVEGLAARLLARKLGVPFALSLQGNSDKKIVSARPDLHVRYRDCWRDASLVFPFSPWIGEWCAAKLGDRLGPIVPLPCIVAAESVLSPSANANRVVTAFNFNDWRNKNISTLAGAVAVAAQDIGNIELHIAGTGSEDSLNMVSSIIARAGITSRTTMHGWIGPQQLQHWMNDAAVFAMPSLRETFGMVFIEALLAGVPIIYPRGAAVDGYFNDQIFASPVNPRDMTALAATLSAHLRQNAARKHALGSFQASGGLGQFKVEAIASRYVDAITQVVGR